MFYRSSSRSLLCILFILLFQAASGQHAVYKQLMAVDRERATTLTSSTLFSRQAGGFRSDQVAKAVKKSTLVKLNRDELRQLYHSKQQRLELSIPYESGNLELELIRTDLFSPDFTVISNESNGQALPIETGAFYRGIVRNDPNSLATFSFFPDEAIGIVATDQGNIVVGNYNTSRKEEYVIYNDHELSQPFSFECQTPEVEPGSELAEEIRRLSSQLKLETRANRCVRFYLELDNTLVTEKGGAQGAVNWISGVYNQIQALYALDQISFTISQIFTWTTNDPYSGSSTSTALNSFRSNRPSYNGDLAHLISRGAPTGGGVAWVNALCSTYGYAYSWVNSSYSNFPTYSWTVNVLAHETGHNLGSPHTHSCTWSGGPIDGCGPTYNSAYKEGTCANGPIPSGGGTIMSYCHLLSTGINLNKGFGPLPATLITNRINAATCLSASCTINVTVPANVNASDGTYSDRVAVGWTGSAGNYFRVYRNTTNNSGTATALGSWQTANTYDDVSAVANQTYYYWVRAASNSSGANISAFSTSNTGWRSSVSVTTPTSVSASDGIYSDRVAVTWTGSSGNYFRVYRNTTNNSGTATALGSWQTANTYDDVSAVANQTYYYWVRAASNSSGANISAFSTSNTGWRSSVSVTTPTSVSASDGIYSDRVAVTWTGSSGNYFRVYRNTTNNSGTATALGSWQTATSYNDASAATNQTYYYWVRAASNSSGANISAFSTSNSGYRSGTSGTSCNPPSSLQASSITTSAFTMSWVSVSGASQYTIWYASGSSWVQLGTTSGTSVRITGMSANTQYCFALRSVCGTTSSALSGSLCIRTTSSSVVSNELPSIDQEGTISFQIQALSKGNISILPNPVSLSGDFQISYYSSEESQAVIRVVDITGKTIDVVDRDLSVGENQISMEAPGVPGIYSVQVQNKTGERRTLKLVVQ
ncbi:MAG TPA: M12 family metallo-peptidase [Saprospiraceae bacterium]|nr:M12 family metallo-peptidase [Saprospiraceae bacterium]